MYYFCGGLIDLNVTPMTLFTDSVFLTDEKEGFRQCRETRTTSTATMSIILCKAGHIDVFYHGQMVRVSKDELFVRIPDFAHELGPYEFSEDFEFLQLTINSELFEDLMFDHMRIEPRWWLKQEYVKEHPIFPMAPKSIEFCETYFKLIQLQLEHELTDYRRQILKSIARSVSMEILNLLDSVLSADRIEDIRISTNSSDYTFHRFTHLLRKHPHQREVQWFAKQLNITPKYLSEICKERSGKTASEWIADVTVSEIKHYLQHSTLPIHEIAQVMEFPNASFFCQYTKKHTGMSPNHFRKRREI